MKKLLLLFLMFFTMILTSCDPTTTNLGKYIEKGNIKTIEKIKYDNKEQHVFVSWVPDHFSELKDFKVEKVEVIETLVDNTSSFLDELLNANILSTYYAYDSPSGICIRLILNSDDFVIVNCTENSYRGYIGKYDSKGNVIGFYGCFENYSSFSNLINYFSKEDI